MYTIWCRVSGGITGTREARLKGKDGKTKYFETEEAAEAEAQRLNREMNGPHSSASFHYEVER